MEISGNMLPLFFQMAMLLVISVAGLWEKMILNPTSLVENATQQMTPILQTSEASIRLVPNIPKLASDIGSINENTFQDLAGILCAYCQRRKLPTDCEPLCQYNVNNVV